MRIAQARVFSYRLPLKRPWVAASATLTERRGALLRLTAEDGIEGWGDCAPLPSGGPVEAVIEALAAAARRLPAGGESGLRRLHAGGESGLRRLAGADFSFPEVQWAIETALTDIAAQRQGLPLAQFLGAAAGTTSVAVNAALGPLGDACAARAREAIAQGYAIGKIKVGIEGVAAELARLQALAEATQGRLRLRLDANRAWTRADAERFLAAIAGLPIDAVEEPLAQPTLAALAALQAGLPYSLAIDESLPQFGADALIEAQAVRRFVLKPARLGGIGATQAIALKARQAGIEIVLTSVVDSAVGVTAAAQLAAALSPSLAHGLGTGAWLAADVAVPPAIAAGRLQLPDSPGLGLRPG